MSALQAVTIAIVISACISTILVAGLMTGQLAQRVSSAALFGAFAALDGIGLRMATVRMPPRA